MTLAERVTEFAGGLEFDDLPADVVASVRLRTLDILGMALGTAVPPLAALAKGRSRTNSISTTPTPSRSRTRRS